MSLRLIRREDREHQGIGFHRIESPFLAADKVQQSLGQPYERFEGLDQLLRAHGHCGGPVSHSDLQPMLEAVESGRWLLVSSDPLSPLSEDSLGKYSHITGKGWAGRLPRMVARDKPRVALPDAEPMIKPQPQEPGFYVVPKSTHREQLEALLFPARNPAVLSRFASLNPYLGDIKAGAMIVLSDPDNRQCTREEALLMAAAARTNEALKPLSADEADFMARHRDEIEMFVSAGSTGLGIGESIFAQHLSAVKSTVMDIEALHQRAFNKDGHLRSPAFFAERKQLLGQLDSRLNALTRKGIGLPDHPNLKHALGISSRSLVHRWTKAGAPEQIPGYATHIEGVARAARFVKYGGWMGTALGGGASYLKVQEVCATGSVEACERVRFTETGSFVGGIAGGALAGMALTGQTVGALCIALGVPTGGIAPLACGVIAVGAGSLAGGAIAGSAGELVGDLIYEGSR